MPRAIATLSLLTFVVLVILMVITKVWPSAFDELEHVSYAAYVQETGDLLPHVEAMRTLSASDLSSWTGRANYLGHPSPYYLYVAQFLDRSLPVAQAITLVRFGSAVLVVLGVFLVISAAKVQFVGLADSERNIQSDFGPFILFCFLLALCPKLLAVAGQVTNDALAFLAGALAYWGTAALDRRPRSSQAALALGILLSLWAKPNAAIAIGAFVGLYSLLRIRSLAMQLPALTGGALLGLIPYGFIFRQYGTVVPITVEQFGHVHQLASFATYLPAFFANVAYTWCFTQTGTWPLTDDAGYAAIAVVWSLLACGFIGAALSRRLAPSTAAIAVAAPFAFLLVLPIHFWFSATRLGFSLPAASFRYYLPIWPGIAHAIAVGAARAPRAWQQRVIFTVAALSVVIGWWSPGATD